MNETAPETALRATMPDLHARLTAALQARLEVARAATPGPWTCVVMPDSERRIRNDDGATVLAVPKGAIADEDIDHFAANDPATEIRRVEALLRVVERHARATVAGVCDWCSNDQWVARAPCPDIRDLAAGEGIEVGDG